MRNIILFAIKISRNVLKYFFLALILIGKAGCLEKEEFETFELEGSIVGFNYCSFHQNGRVGYVIISNDLADTIATYSLSPSRLRLPAPVGTNSNRPIFTIPEEAFYHEGVVRSAEMLSQTFPIKVKYRRATQKEKDGSIRGCLTADTTASFAPGIWLDKLVVVQSASIN
ncbi:hypothetical protein BC751_2036 [Cecembia calidifontis]|uniref:Uncharacterized protein n=1 Tax=Cecembia calidifontis TaxID=1187080 RepID=A0A4Q7P8N6_9BACT|nr:hypothetical protein BC751_2036 [Cecembia calidifontis]